MVSTEGCHAGIVQQNIAHCNVQSYMDIAALLRSVYREEGYPARYSQKWLTGVGVKRLVVLTRTGRRPRA